MRDKNGKQGWAPTTEDSPSPWASTLSYKQRERETEVVSLYRKGPRAQALLGAEPRGLTLLPGIPRGPISSRASCLLPWGVCRDHQRGSWEGRDCKGHLSS